VDDDMPEFDMPPDLVRSMAELSFRMEQRQAARNQEIIESKVNIISDDAFLCWKSEAPEMKGLRFYLCASRVWESFQKMDSDPDPEIRRIGARYSAEFGKYNGYVQFPNLPTVAPGYKGILAYVPVHGGITYFQQWWDGSVTYGFDTGHSHSEEMGETINDMGWLMAEAESMARNILIVARFEPYYLNARTEERKAVVLNRMNRFLQIDVMGNMGVMLNLLSGEL
jgi:hypothetical protein